jgi:hypothetical protein
VNPECPGITRRHVWSEKSLGCDAQHRRRHGRSDLLHDRLGFLGSRCDMDVAGLRGMGRGRGKINVSEPVVERGAADVVQTTWLELVRQLQAIRSPLALTNWLVRATKREAWRVNARRRKSSGVGPEALDDAPADVPAPDHQLLTHERDRTLWRHFARLSQRCRTLLELVAHADRNVFQNDFTSILPLGCRCFRNGVFTLSPLRCGCPLQREGRLTSRKYTFRRFGR